MAQSERDYYVILEVQRTASLEEIKKSYHRLALRHHPDKNGNSSSATAKFQLLSTAWETLSDPTKRRAYDAKYPRATPQYDWRQSGAYWGTPFTDTSASEEREHEEREKQEAAKREKEWQNWMKMQRHMIDETKATITKLTVELEDLHYRDRMAERELAASNSWANTFSLWNKVSLTSADKIAMDAERLQRDAARRIKLSKMDEMKRHIEALERDVTRKRNEHAQEEARINQENWQRKRNREARRQKEREAKQAEERRRAAQERQKRENEARAAREKAAKDARERAAREAREKAAQEQRERAAKEARERAAREAREKAAREQQERATRAAQEKIKRETREQAAREARERAAIYEKLKAANEREMAARGAKEEAMRGAGAKATPVRRKMPQEEKKGSRKGTEANPQWRKRAASEEQRTANVGAQPGPNKAAEQKSKNAGTQAAQKRATEQATPEGKTSNAKEGSTKWNTNNRKKTAKAKRPQEENVAPKTKSGQERDHAGGVSCNHQRYWSKRDGGNECAHCHMMQKKFLYECPGCNTFACASCMRTLKTGN